MNTILFVGEHTEHRDVRWHSHDYWELVYCTSGQGIFHFDNGSTIAYRTGDVVAIPPRERHANSSDIGFTNLNMTIDEPSFPYRAPFRITDDEDGSLRSAFSQAKLYYSARIKKREIVLSALGELISAYVVVFRSNTELSEPVEQIRDAILRNYSRPDFALDEMIRSLPFHYDYLRKRFKKEVGASPLEYMTNLRMKSAETLLTAMWANEYTITEIAQMCGFEDSLYFSRVFKKYYGCAPSNYANRQQEPHAVDPSRVELELPGA